MSVVRKMVRVAQMEVAGPGEVLVTLGLGSCVAVLLHDPAVRVAGLAHILLPDESASRDRGNPAKFATTAVPLLVERMVAQGARPERMVARLVGGASMFAGLLSQNAIPTGARNVDAAREALRAAGIPVVAEDVGLEHGRSLVFHPEDGRVEVNTVQQGRRDL